MNNIKVGASLAATLILLALRVYFSYGDSEPIPFKLLDALIVTTAALLIVFVMHAYIKKRYPDTAEMLPLFCVIFLSTLIISYFILRYYADYQTSLSILVTGVFIGMGWWIQAITTAANARRTHTLNIIMSSRTSTEYQAQTRNSSNIYRGGCAIPAELADWRFNPHKDEFKNAKIPKEIEDAIQGTIYILNYFEFLAQGIKFKDLDDCLLRECFCAILAGLERRSFHLIIEAQKTEPRSFEGVIRLTKEWNKESVVEKYRANPDNASIGTLYPSKDDLNRMINGTADAAANDNVVPIKLEEHPSKADDIPAS